jgi:hypothetical protein
MHVGDRAAVQPGRHRDPNGTTSDRQCADRIRYGYIAGRDCATTVYFVRRDDADCTTYGDTGTDRSLSG